MRKDINIIIQQRRKELGYTLEYVGDKLGVAKSTVLRWENGETSKIKLFQLKVLAEVLHLDYQTLLDENSDCNPEDASVVLKRNKIKSKLDSVKTLNELEQVDTFIDAFILKK